MPYINMVSHWHPLLIGAAYTYTAAFNAASDWLRREDKIARAELKAKGLGPNPLPQPDLDDPYAGIPEADFIEYNGEVDG